MQLRCLGGRAPRYRVAMALMCIYPPTVIPFSSKLNGGRGEGQGTRLKSQVNCLLT